MSQWTTITIAGQTWTLGPSLGSGGFGEVHLAESHGQWAAIKLVPKDPGAGRELLFADNLRGARNVLPVQGTSETDTHWALLMPKAEASLRQYLVEAGGPLHEAEALPVLIDVARALVSLAATGVVHRDLKPENVLLYQGTWCLADFGISRYADAATAKDTRKYSTTRPYAAPEQWRDETATAATDVYALGVVSHELLTGSRPFPGPDFRHQHLHEDPPVITTVAPALAALVEQCLFKAPGARPTAQDLLNRLERQAGSSTVSRGLAALQAANLAAASQLARGARQESEARSDDERRADLLLAARKQFEQISAHLKHAILSTASTATLLHIEMPSWQIVLGGAQLQISTVFPGTNGRLNALARQPASARSFDIIAFGELIVTGPGGHDGSDRRSHVLLFCDAGEPGRYGWYEVAGDATAARRFMLLQVGELGEFIDRWASWLAGSPVVPLHEPSWTPEDPGGPLQSQTTGRGRSGVWGRLVGSLKGSPAPSDIAEAAAHEERERAQFLQDYDANPILDWSASRRPRSAILADEMILGTDAQTREQTRWMRPLVDILQKELAVRGEFEVLGVANAFRRDVAEHAGRQPEDTEEPSSSWSSSLKQALQVLLEAKFVYDRRGVIPRSQEEKHYSDMVQVLSVGAATAAPVTHDPFDAGPAGQRARRQLAMKFVELGGQLTSSDVSR